LVRLGQNFLADPNLLDAIVRDAELDPADVVLEVGAGEGVLTERLAAAAAHVHTVEIDRGLEPALAPIAALDNVSLHWGDAMKIDLAGFAPAPTAMVANLPYSVATPLILRTIEQLPSLRSWTVMVQREIADRLFASPGTKAYGAVSVLVQLACERLGRRPVSRKVFAPQPNVDSALVAFRRRPGVELGDDWEWTSHVVHAAFAHRRKTLANALALADLPAPPAEVAGLRAEQLPPERLALLARELR